MTPIVGPGTGAGRGRSRDTIGGAADRPPRARRAPEGRPQARLGRREVGVIGGRRRDQGHARGGPPPGRRRGPAGAGSRRALRAARSRLRARPRAAVVDRHLRAGVGQEAGQGEPAAGQAQDGDRPAGAAPRSTDAGQRQAVEVDRGSSLIIASAWIEARKRVTPSIAGQDADDPEAQGDLLLVPAAQLEVVVERGHPEDALAAGQP